MALCIQHLCYMEIAQGTSWVLIEVPGPKSKRWCSPECHERQLGSQQDAATGEAAPEVQAETTRAAPAGMFLPGLLLPGPKGQKQGGLHSTQRKSPRGSPSDILPPHPQRAVPLGLHVSLRGMTNTLQNERVPLRPTSGSSAWPHAVCSQSQRMTWADQVTHHVTSASGTKQWHGEYLKLPPVSEVRHSVNTVLSAVCAL